MGMRRQTKVITSVNGNGVDKVINLNVALLFGGIVPIPKRYMER
jgi:hypothetical protein